MQSQVLAFSNLFLIPLRWCYDPVASLCGWFCTPLSLCQLSQCQAFYVLFQYLSVLQNSSGFCISRFSATALDDESTTSLHILLQISCTEASVLFFHFYYGVFYTDFLLTANWEEEQAICVTLSTFSLHSLHRGIHPVCQWHILLSSFKEPVSGQHR